MAGRPPEWPHLLNVQRHRAKTRVQPAGLPHARVRRPGDQHFSLCGKVTRDGHAENFSQRRSWAGQFPAITPFSVALVPAALDRSSERKARPGTFL